MANRPARLVTAVSSEFLAFGCCDTLAATVAAQPHSSWLTTSIWSITMHTHARKMVLGPYRQNKSSSTAQAMTSRTSPVRVNRPAQRLGLASPRLSSCDPGQLPRETHRARKPWGSTPCRVTAKRASYCVLVYIDQSMYRYKLCSRILW